MPEPEVVVTLYVVEDGPTPKLLRGTYKELPNSYRALERDWTMRVTLNKSDMGLYAPTPVDAWAHYVALKTSEKQQHQKRADECAKRINWAGAQERKLRLNAGSSRLLDEQIGPECFGGSDYP